ncbi:MAG TPA: MoxR family ATPase [Candidatus Nanoarchaeia archaeon]|nr:MoxR family ATPase [Candidatus Nanoarchaeia archaeon]
MGNQGQDIRQYAAQLESIRKELSRIIVGQERIITGLLRALLANGHVLVEGVPGTAKTLVIRALAAVTGCKFSRIQFTVDLLPTDITGITIYEERKGFSIVKGPIFAEFVLADEINRAPAKTQSALLEAMQEKQVTIGKETFRLQDPFFVMATQNPIESTGTYQLPEAQMDRFLFKILIDYPSLDEEKTVIDTNINIHKFEEYQLKNIVGPNDIVKMQQVVKDIYLGEDIKKYIVSIVDASRHPQKYNVALGKYIEWGASPRASINLSIAAKAEALLHGSDYVDPQFVKNVALDILRHRILLNYEGIAEGIRTDDVVKEILVRVPIP